MGIFDEAIREHLDLKRRQGAAEDELKELEDEAFGLPARPGDEAQAPETPPAEDGEGEAPATPAAETPEPAAEPPPEAIPEPSDDAPPHGDAVLDDPAAEPPSAPHDEGPVEDEGAPFTTSEREAIAEQRTEFFDHAPEPLELGELDLDLDDELDEVGAIEEEPVTGEEQAGQAPPPEAEPEAEAETPVEPETEREEPSSPEPEPEPEAEAEAEAEDGDDVLEETPEFLRENPDDDELWFEQGKPKDFDF